MYAVEFFSVADAPRMREALALRTRVFVDEQHVPADAEIDAHDRSGSTAIHALVSDGSHYIAAGRFYVRNPATVQIGRMAVTASSRGRGAGACLLRALGEEAWRRGYARAHLHAQMHARAFYLRAGYFDDGEPLMDAGILHQPMSKNLARAGFNSGATVL